ncbi:MAG: DJ-1/PfpI family protein [Roseiflexaceae bacterium]|nr:DJ-1/PfpI family protein [Roseiflexaceae bacterium]
METRKRSVAILIFDDVELLDFAGPFEVFSSARDMHGDHGRIMDVFAIAETAAPIRCRNGLVVQPEHTLETCPPFDILVVPGGAGTIAVVQRPNVIDWIRQRTTEIELLTSVCTGSFVLAKVGLPAGTPVTTYWESIAQLRAAYPELEVREDSRWVDAGPIITGAGVSAGIDMALYILSKLYGADVARTTAIGIEYDYWN